jgi:ubiquinone/menaquinone biosynthesis C-methylase UbiE
MIVEIHDRKAGPVEILDIGGSLEFWLSTPQSCRAKANISLINLPDAYQVPLSDAQQKLAETIKLLVGDARDLSNLPDQTFDLVVCNSVIEHVGNWSDMKKAAAEARRIGKQGWIQVPAYEFPIDQHFILPCLHWLSFPVQVTLLSVFGNRWFKSLSYDDKFSVVEQMRPLTKKQFRHLFPTEDIRSEWLIVPKSHIAVW